VSDILGHQQQICRLFQNWQKQLLSAVRKLALCAFPFLHFLSQIAVTSGRLGRQNHSVTRGDGGKERGGRGITPQLEEVAGKRKEKVTGWQQYGM